MDTVEKIEPRKKKFALIPFIIGEYYKYIRMDVKNGRHHAEAGGRRHIHDGEPHGTVHAGFQQKI